MLGLLTAEDSAAAKILDGRGVTKEKLYEILGAEETVGGSAYGLSAGDMTPRTKRIIERSSYEATNFGQSYIGSEHLLLALIKESDCVAVKLLSALGVSVREIYNDILAYLKGSGEKESVSEEDGDLRGEESKSAGGGKFLQRYGRDLTKAAKEGKLDPIIGREEETERVIQILSRRTKNNPCLIGEPGVGKTAVVEGLAIRIAEHRVPENLAGKRIVTLELSGMIAGAKYRGEFEERMKGIMNEVKKDPSVILFIDEIPYHRRRRRGRGRGGRGEYFKAGSRKGRPAGDRRHHHCRVQEIY